MLRDFLGDWCTGSLGQRRFAVLWAIVVVVLVVSIFLAFAGAITWVALVNPDGSFGAAAWLAIALIGAIVLMTVALFNIVIKRGRDIGLPGFVTAIGFVALCAMGGLTIFLSILLALVPSGAFARSRA